MRHLDLFSGIGGFALAAKWAGFDTVAFCEIEPYCQKVLRKNFGDGITIHDDIRQLDGSQYRGIDLITGGFPCQPYSIAGKRRGDDDPRALWPEMRRIIHEAKPTWVVGENVAHFANMGLDAACADLENEGYEVQPFVIPAVAIGAPHTRKRVFIVAYSERLGRRGRDNGDALEYGRTLQIEGSGTAHQRGISTPLAHSNSGISGSEGGNALHEGCQAREDGRTGIPQATRRQDGAAIRNAEPAGADVSDTDRRQMGRPTISWEKCGQWSIEPAVGRVANGIPARVDRLRALGNAVVPQQVYPILRLIAEQIAIDLPLFAEVIK